MDVDIDRSRDWYCYALTTIILSIGRAFDRAPLTSPPAAVRPPECRRGLCATAGAALFGSQYLLRKSGHYNLRLATDVAAARCRGHLALSVCPRRHGRASPLWPVSY